MSEVETVCFCKCHTCNIGHKCKDCRCDVDLVCPRCGSKDIVDGADEGFYGDRLCHVCKYVDERLQFEPEKVLTNGSESE